MRGEVAFVDGKILVKPGFGEDVRTWKTKPVPSIKILSPLKPTFADDLGTDGGSRVRYESGGGRTPRQRENSGHFPGTPRQRRGSGQFDLTDLAPLGDPLIPVGLPMPTNSNSIANRHILVAGMFNKEQLNAIFNLADTFRLVWCLCPIIYILRTYCV